MIPLFGVDRQTARLRPALDAAFARVMDHGKFILGPEVEAFEAQLAAHAGAEIAVGVSSGWDALYVALAGEGIGPGDAVFVPAFTFTATADAVIVCGATPVFVDVDPRTFDMDAEALRAAVARVWDEGRLTPRAVIPVDLFGLPADYAAIAAVAEDQPEPLAVIADAAQSYGGEAGGRRVGTLAPMTCLSFYPTKPLGGVGDGGAILTDDPDRAARWRSIRNCGRGPDGLQHAHVGPTARLDTLQAAALSVKLAGFDAELARKRAVAAAYDAALAGVVDTPAVPAGRRSAWALYTVLTDRRDALRAALAAAGIGCAVYYPQPLHRHPAFAGLAPAEGTLSVAESLSARVLSLPMHAELTDDEVSRVCAAVVGALGA
jgi:dTDP-4-amino-4,6-dideoxygalactose transaminase